jgi:hypothetical protein
MKNKDIFSFMFNPFTRIAGWQAFGLGLVFVISMGVIGTYSNVSFNGALDAHFVQHMTFISSLSLLAIDLISLILIMWITGLIISKGFRFIDILGTMTLAKAPLIIIAFAGYFNTTIFQNTIPKNPVEMFQSISFIMIMIVSLFSIIWNITLLYNALRISCDVKGTKLTIAFIIALVVSEAVSQIVIYKLM